MLKNIHNEPYVLLSKLKDILGYKDIRPVLKWCEKNGVCIIHQGNRKLVNSGEFLLSYYKPFISHLKQKHQNWKELFVHYLEGNLQHLIADTPSPSVEVQTSPRKGKQSSFLNMLKKL